MKRIILLTAWNDSGAGHLCRYLDGSSYLNVLPFELLLGNRQNVYISNHSELVHSWYRWNLFRDGINFSSFLDFAEPELKSWLSQSKFKLIPEYIAKAQTSISLFFQQANTNNDKSFIDITKEYIYMINDLFYPDSNADILIHVPCAMLDSCHPYFQQVFDKIIVAFSNPVCGYMNMKKRNNINPLRYFDRWYTINNLSLIFCNSNEADSCMISNTLAQAHFVQNTLKIYNFLGIPHSSGRIVPTLLGNHLENPFYPFGGLLSLNNEYSSDIFNDFNFAYDDDMLSSYFKCSGLYSVLQKYAK